ncbi:hypothetical protein WA026_000306 [Henosepilachna vigintioctopunctata]|uniref:Uncharacterized protein n=1 Tax=Henosepilachna vigintioctopunctata TaxID=420089 RepID=A0AAW1V5M0_9CUCU
MRNKIKKATIARAKHFRSLTYKKEGISIATASKIYKMICRPLLEYGHPLFLNVSKALLTNLEIGERTSLRKITKIRNPKNPVLNPSNELLYKTTQKEPIIDRIKRAGKKFITRENNKNIILPLLHEYNRVNPPKRKLLSLACSNTYVH